MSHFYKRSFVSHYSHSGNKAYLTLPLAESSDHDVYNSEIVGLNPVWAIYIRAELDDPCGSLPTQNILPICEISFPCQHRRPRVFCLLPSAPWTAPCPSRRAAPSDPGMLQNSPERPGRALHGCKTCWFLHLLRKRNDRDWCLSSGVNVQCIQECYTNGGILWGLVAPKALTARCEWVIWVKTSRGQRNDVCPSENARQSKEGGRDCYTTLLPIPFKNRCQMCKIPLAHLLHQHKVCKLWQWIVFLL